MDNIARLNSNAINPIWITNFEIKKLFGYRDLSIEFGSSILLIVGENGYGKTTIINLIAGLLNNDFKRLLQYQFESISISFENEKEPLEFSYSLLKEYNEWESDGSIPTKNAELRFIKDEIGENKFNKLKKLAFKLDFSAFANKYETMFQSLFYLSTEELFQKLRAEALYENRFRKILTLRGIVEKSKIKMLFFPTWRRVEANFERLKHKTLTDVSNKHLSSHFRHRSELLTVEDLDVKFGMKDVEDRIDDFTGRIRSETVKAYGNITGGMIDRLLDINQKTNDNSPKFNFHEIEVVLQRIGDKLSDESKRQILMGINTKDRYFFENKYLMYFLNELINVYRSFEIYDKAIKDFANVCNKYLYNKEFVYDENKVTLKIRRKDSHAKEGKEYLTFDTLSSGEKQLISIMADVYLNDDNRNLVFIIDEPETSMSIYWQPNFLIDIINSSKCKLLIAATHSPYIFNNDLVDYTVGASDFINEKN